MLDSDYSRDSEEARPNRRQAIDWPKTSWNDVSPEIIKTDGTW
jgi:hypothetical protein